MSIKKLGWQYSHILHNWTHSSVIHVHVRMTQLGIKIQHETFSYDSNMKNNNKKKKLVPGLLFQKSQDAENWKGWIKNWITCPVNNLFLLNFKATNMRSKHKGGMLLICHLYKE